MIVLLYAGSGIFLLLAIALIFTWWRGRHPGALLLAAVYAVAAALALMLHSGWPLAMGLLSAWALRLMGLDPDRNPPPEQ